MGKLITGFAFIAVGFAWIIDVGHVVSGMSKLHARQLGLKVDGTKFSYGYRVLGLFFVGCGVALLVGAV